MPLKENSDRELRKYCLEKSLGFFSHVASAQEITTVAEHFFQYIKNGDDTENDADDEPTPPANTGPGITRLRDMLLRNRDIPSYTNQ